MAMQKGPGKAYDKGLSLVDIVKKFDTEEKAEEWFIAQRWQDGITCPFCHSQEVSERHKRKPQPFRCRNCRKDFSVKTGSVLHSSNIPLSKWAIAFYLYMTNLKGASSMKLHRDLGVTQKAAWHMAHRIRETMKAENNQFAGPIEADETYVGGKESNKHEAKNLKAGRGTIGKTPVAGVKDSAINLVGAAVVERTDGPTLRNFVHQRTEETATVYTDEAAATTARTVPMKRSLMALAST